MRVDIRTVDGGNVEVKNIEGGDVLHLLRAFESHEDEYGNPLHTVRLELDRDEQTSIAVRHIVRIDIDELPTD